MTTPAITQAMIDAYDEYTHLTLDRRGFMEKLTKLAGSGALDAEASRRAWTPASPFFRVPAGTGSFAALLRAAGGRSLLYRQVDLRFGAKPVLALGGIPGTVGSGSRALWKELLAGRDRSLALWPFDGELEPLGGAL